MTRIFSVCLSCFALLLISGQQSVAQFPLRIGAAAGMNLANQSFSPDLYPAGNPKGFRTGFAAGGLAEIGISNLLSVQLEPKYTQKGTKFHDITTTNTTPTPNGTTDATFKLDYFEIPILLKVCSESQTIKPFAFV